MAIPPHSPLLFLLSAPRTQFSERATQATTVDGNVWWEWFLSPMWDTLLYLQYRILWSVAQLQRNHTALDFMLFYYNIWHCKWISKNTTITTSKTPTPWCSCSPIFTARLCGISSPHPLWSLCRRGWWRTVLQDFVNTSQMAEKNKRN